MKPKRGEVQRADKTRRNLTPNHHSCPSLSHLTSSPQTVEKCAGARERSSTWRGQKDEGEIRYRLMMIGFQPVSHLTTMSMLPWVVAEICRCVKKDQSPGGVQMDPLSCNKTVLLYVSMSSVRCVSTMGEQSLWDPLTHNVLFECRPHQVTKLIHNSQEPSIFACLVRDPLGSACYVFQCLDSTKVPEIISTLRQAGKSSARNNELTTDSSKTTITPISAVSPTTFAKKFEVLFCGRVSVAHKKAPPALIDECIEKFSKLHGSGSSDKGGNGGRLVDGLRRALSFQSNGLGGGSVRNGSAGSPSSGTQPVLFKRGHSFPSLDALDENGLSPEISNADTTDLFNSPAKVQPTSLQENRTMLFTVGKSQIFLVSPDTKKVSIEKGFREISFCSQGIRHVDHFGFICRETDESGNWHFVCYVFQCTDESLVDEIMLTLKQAFTVAALQQNAKTQSQQCDCCPMHQLHRLCESIEGSRKDRFKAWFMLDAFTFGAVMRLRARPKSDQEENELVMASLRNLYEEKQKNHQHSLPGDNKQVVSTLLNHLKTTPPMSVFSPSLVTFPTFVVLVRNSLHSVLVNVGPSQGQGLTVSPCLFFRGHNSTGDLKLLGSSPPLSFTSSSLPGDPELQGFRRRASTFSHSPSSSSVFEFSPLHKQSHTGQDTNTSSKPKLVRHYSVSTDSPHQMSQTLKLCVCVCVCVCVYSDVAGLSTSRAAGVLEESPLRSHRHSWRQQIFLRVATPQKATDSNGTYGDLIIPVASGSGDPMTAVPEESTKRSKEELRELWRKAILQQILLQRMERENQKLQASESDLQNRRLKLDYEEITPCLKEVTLVWEKMLGTPGRSKVKFDLDTIHAAVTQGVPRQHRGEIWKFLSEQYLLRQTVPSRPPSNSSPYKELLKQLTSQQHAILIDLGRTFPTHPYFQAQLGAGQLSLYNILKAYSLLDPEVGYCQGLSFIAGVLLLHMGEEDAFNMLKFLMFDAGLRKQYRPDMIILQIQMYQLSRLLHDYHRDLHSHLEQQEIGPSLYATPWFLTLFASHFPLGFVARVFDMLFLQGSEVIFKVALSLLGSHKPLILQHDSLESIVDFIKTTLPNLGLVQMEKTINQVCEMDVSKQLQAYEVEYHVLQDELLDTPPTLNQQQRAAQLERTNQSLRQQNLDLLEELQVSQAQVCSLESRVEALAKSEGRLKEQVSSLEEEKLKLVGTITQLKNLLTSMGLSSSLDGQTVT
uniref:TBC1 domain family member 4 n=1 Tax=Nothobranchius furzeri TaxID=105023 RepID=A0A8C6LAK1_NOTFU